MDLLALLTAHAGLVSFTVIAIGLVLFLAYAMVRPDTF